MLPAPSFTEEGQRLMVSHLGEQNWLVVLQWQDKSNCEQADRPAR